MLVGLARCAVNADVLQVGIYSEFMEHLFENALLLPFCKAFVYRVPFENFL